MFFGQERRQTGLAFFHAEVTTAWDALTAAVLCTVKYMFLGARRRSSLGQNRADSHQPGSPQQPISPLAATGCEGQLPQARGFTARSSPLGNLTSSPAPRTCRRRRRAHWCSAGQKFSSSTLQPSARAKRMTISGPPEGTFKPTRRATEGRNQWPTVTRGSPAFN